MNYVLKPPNNTVISSNGIIQFTNVKYSAGTSHLALTFAALNRGVEYKLLPESLPCFTCWRRLKWRTQQMCQLFVFSCLVRAQ